MRWKVAADRPPAIRESAGTAEDGAAVGEAISARLAALAQRERLAPANGIELAYDEIGDPDGAPLLLIMGLAAQLIHWDERFCRLLADRGYRVIRFDNRDIGHSTKIDWAGRSGSLGMLFGLGEPPYLLRDMALDTAGLLDHLDIERAHVVGASMGGMIAQTMAIGHPERVLSLTSMMSTTGNRRLGMPRLRAFGTLFARPPRSREGYAEQAVKTFKVIGSPAYPMDEERFRMMALAAYDRCFYPPGVARQMHAVTSSGNRTKQLRELRLPALVIHGDSDPLIRTAAGRATARAIPDARLRIIEGMGHDLPPQVWPTLVEEIDANAGRAGVPQRARL
jgi:pimeloyl-ACP methyl ester carboxylesterase